MENNTPQPQSPSNTSGKTIGIIGLVIIAFFAGYMLNGTIQGIAISFNEGSAARPGGGGGGGGTTAPDLTAKLELLGNPARALFPADIADDTGTCAEFLAGKGHATARIVWDMFVSGDKLFVADGQNDPGGHISTYGAPYGSPVKILTYDLGTGSFDSEIVSTYLPSVNTENKSQQPSPCSGGLPVYPPPSDPYTEGIALFKMIDGAVTFPGSHHRKWSGYSFSRLSDGSWLQSGPIPRMETVTDVESFDGKLFAAGATVYATQGGGIAGGVKYSTDGGTSWPTIEPFIPDTNGGIHYAGYTFFKLGGKFYVQAEQNSCVHQVSGVTRVRKVYEYDPVAVQFNEVPGATMTNGLKFNNQRIIPPIVSIGDRIFYLARGMARSDECDETSNKFNPPVAVMSATTPSDSKSAGFITYNKSSTPSEYPMDILKVTDSAGKERVLALTMKTSGKTNFINTVWASSPVLSATDPITWKPLLKFTAIAPAYSFESHDGNLYFGLGVWRWGFLDYAVGMSGSGNILRIGKADVPVY